MTTIELVFFWLTVSSYMGSALWQAYWFIFQKNGGEKWERLLLYTGLAANIAALLTRSIISGHLPLAYRYEGNMFIAAVIVAGFLVWRKKRLLGVSLPAMGVVCLPFALLALSLAYSSPVDTKLLTVVYLSRWLVIHTMFTLLAAVCFIYATGCSIFYLLKSRYQPGEQPLRLADLPSLEVLGELSFRLVLYGFVGWTVMLVSGVFWAKDLWGSYWSWDPVETWSLISWIAWGVYIHLHFTHGWQGKKLAWLCIVSLLISIISLWGVGLLTPTSNHMF